MRFGFLFFFWILFCFDGKTQDCKSNIDLEQLDANKQLVRLQTKFYKYADNRIEFDRHIAFEIADTNRVFVKFKFTDGDYVRIVEGTKIKFTFVSGAHFSLQVRDIEYYLVGTDLWVTEFRCQLDQRSQITSLTRDFVKEIEFVHNHVIDLVSENKSQKIVALMNCAITSVGQENVKYNYLEIKENLDLEKLSDECANIKGDVNMNDDSVYYSPTSYPLVLKKYIIDEQIIYYVIVAIAIDYYGQIEPGVILYFEGDRRLEFPVEYVWKDSNLLKSVLKAQIVLNQEDMVLFTTDRVGFVSIANQLIPISVEDAVAIQGYANCLYYQ